MRFNISSVLALLFAFTLDVQSTGVSVNTTFNPPVDWTPLTPLNPSKLGDKRDPVDVLVPRADGCGIGYTECNDICCDLSDTCCGDGCCIGISECADEDLGLCCGAGKEKCGNYCYDPILETCCENGGSCDNFAECCGSMCCISGNHCENGECVGDYDFDFDDPDSDSDDDSTWGPDLISGASTGVVLSLRIVGFLSVAWVTWWYMRR